MKNLINGIIIDPLKDEHDYSLIERTSKNIHKTDYGDATDLELVILEKPDNIMSELNNVRFFDFIITVGDVDMKKLEIMPYEYRKKWSHVDNFDIDTIYNVALSNFLLNVNRKGQQKLFSIFTCTFNTKQDDIDRLYRSLCYQTYQNWNWWILDDSLDDSVCKKIKRLNDPRIFYFQNKSNHGNIGFNKHMIASMANGDYLVEVDHDDELTNDCLAYLYKAFETYNCDFAYSYVMEVVDDAPVYYGDNYALGLGYYEEHEIFGQKFVIPTTPDINVLSIRHIVSLPNHVRCWEKNFYHRIGGHNPEISILDDMDILIRTFLNGTMCKIPKPLYIQYEGKSSGGQRSSTTQSKRMSEIWRTGFLLKQKYDKLIHDYALKHGVEDPYWVEDEEGGYSDIYHGVKEGTVNFNYTLEIEKPVEGLVEEEKKDTE